MLFQTPQHLNYNAENETCKRVVTLRIWTMTAINKTPVEMSGKDIAYPYEPLFAPSSYRSTSGRSNVQ